MRPVVEITKHNLIRRDVYMPCRVMAGLLSTTKCDSPKYLKVIQVYWKYESMTNYSNCDWLHRSTGHYVDQLKRSKIRYHSVTSVILGNISVFPDVLFYIIMHCNCKQVSVILKNLKFMSSLKKKSFFNLGYSHFFHSFIHCFHHRNIFPKKVKICKLIDKIENSRNVK